jgi:cysteine-rich repeat protein
MYAAVRRLLIRPNMQITKFATSLTFACAALAGCIDGTSQDGQAQTGQDLKTGMGPISGAIFTTLSDGSRVDANIYAAKTDVYLDGGPGPRAPQTAAGLPNGDYYFQVTDPAGKIVLSQDDISCRRVRVADGVIAEVYRGNTGCLHRSGIDEDHGAVTVQLMPYADTPNPGGEYKAWMTPVDDYDGKFEHRFSKTDNFKVRASEQCVGSECQPPPPPPCCGDGHLDAGEQCDDGNTVDGDGCSSTCQIEETTCPG